MYSGTIQLQSTSAVHIPLELLGSSSLIYDGYGMTISQLLFDSNGTMFGFASELVINKFTWTGRGLINYCENITIVDYVNLTSTFPKRTISSLIQVNKGSIMNWEGGDILVDSGSIFNYGNLSTNNASSNDQQLSYYGSLVNGGRVNFTQQKVRIVRGEYNDYGELLTGNIIFESTKVILQSSVTKDLNAIFNACSVNFSQDMIGMGNFTFLNDNVFSQIYGPLASNPVFQLVGYMSHENLVLNGIDLDINYISQVVSYGSCEIVGGSKIMNYGTHRVLAPSSSLIQDISSYLNYGIIDLKSTTLFNWTTKTTDVQPVFFNYGTIQMGSSVYFERIDMRSCVGSHINIFHVPTSRIYFDSNAMIDLSCTINLVYDSQSQVDAVDSINNYSIFSIKNYSNFTMNDGVPTLNGVAMNFTAFPSSINASTNYLCWSLDVNGTGAGQIFGGIYNSSGKCITLNQTSLCPQVTIPPTLPPVDPPIDPPTQPPTTPPTLPPSLPPTLTPTQTPTLPPSLPPTLTPSPQLPPVIIINNTIITNSEQNFTDYSEVYFNNSITIQNSTLTFVSLTIVNFTNDLVLGDSKIKITNGSTLQVTGNVTFLNNSSIDIVLGSTGTTSANTYPVSISGCVNADSNTKILNVKLNQKASTANVPVISYTCSNKDIKPLVSLSLDKSCSSSVSVESVRRGQATQLYIPVFDCSSTSNSNASLTTSINSLLIAIVFQIVLWICFM
eukprot:TRINITY_DN5468_c0_g1_i4.p1 TRINITY_DN5468_c0_g1~~TRINITY_DN5468_c0_g1_i4.p1  ORF type:complete len:728 (-),score=91.25 TRINITY_DN5468_c0_g1_i4:14-2197(-)